MINDAHPKERANIFDNFISSAEFEHIVWCVNHIIFQIYSSPTHFVYHIYLSNDSNQDRGTLLHDFMVKSLGLNVPIGKLCTPYGCNSEDGKI